MKNSLDEWLKTEEGLFWEEKANQSADDGDGYYDDIIATFFTLYGEKPNSNNISIDYKDIPRFRRDN